MIYTLHTFDTQLILFLLYRSQSERTCQKKNMFVGRMGGQYKDKEGKKTKKKQRKIPIFKIFEFFFLCPKDSFNKGILVPMLHIGTFKL